MDRGTDALASNVPEQDLAVAPHLFTATTDYRLAQTTLAVVVVSAAKRHLPAARVLYWT